jgi:formate dehydrogenase assembly factor FdhD
MHINYKLNTNELDDDFLESVKIMFKDKDITISIDDMENDEDFALGKSIEEGLVSESVSRKELDKVLYAD